MPGSASDTEGTAVSKMDKNHGSHGADSLGEGDKTVKKLIY